MASDNYTAKPLHPTTIKNLKPGDKPIRDIKENAGLNVSVNRYGQKRFFYRYRSPLTGKVTEFTLGLFTARKQDEDLSRPIGEKIMTLSSARMLLEELKMQRKSGICPKSKAETDRKAALTEQAHQDLTMQGLVEVYLTQNIEDHYSAPDKDGKRKKISGSRKLKGQAETRRTLEAVVGKDKPTPFGQRPAIAVSYKEIINVISGILAAGHRVQAGRVLMELNAAFRFCIGRPIINSDGVQEDLEYLPDEHTNPCLRAKEYFRVQKVTFKPKPGQRYLKDHELTAFLKWLPDSRFTPIAKHCLWIVLYTGCRSGEIVAARKDEFDLTAGTWTRPTKMGFEQTTQLSRQVIERIKPLLGDPDNETAYLLPSSRMRKPYKSRKPYLQKQISEQAWQLRKKGLMIDLPSWSAHDLRRSCRTGLARLGCPGEVAEAVLGHVKGGIEGVYNLHSYADECRTWLQRWADHLDTLAGKSTDDNVIPLRGAS